MQFLKPYLELCRISNLPTVWINTLAAYIISGGLFPGEDISVAAGHVLMYCGGMAMNDWLDLDLDSRHRPDRPIPSGRISADDARITWVSFFTLALCIFFAAGGYVAFCAALILLLFIITYNLGHRFSPLAVIPMAGCRFMIYIITGIAAAGNTNILLLFLATFQFGYVLLLTLIARREKGLGETVSKVPWLLAGMPLLDGLALALLVSIGWLAAGVVGGVATLAAQGRIRGD